jgi:hypothetical protein
MTTMTHFAVACARHDAKGPRAFGAYGRPTRGGRGPIGWLAPACWSLIAEYRRAVAAAQRYDELVASSRRVSRLVGTRSIPRTIFDQFYSGRATLP